MSPLLDSGWRAAVWCLHPRVIALSLLPLALMLVLGAGLAYFFWNPALASLMDWIGNSGFYTRATGWLLRLGIGDVRPFLATLLLVLGLAPLVVILALLLVAWLMTPAVLRLVAARRFALLERRGEDSLWRSALWSLGQTAIALVLLVLSLPLWLVPPLILILPPLIWGWLTYRVMSHDALDVHASRAERQAILRRHRSALLVIGVVCGYLGAAPAVVWASFTLFAVAFAVLIPLAVWIYTLVFAFSALWFTHYCLAALQALRTQAPGAVPLAVDQATPALGHEP